MGIGIFGKILGAIPKLIPKAIGIVKNVVGKIIPGIKKGVDVVGKVAEVAQPIMEMLPSKQKEPPPQPVQQMPIQPIQQMPVYTGGAAGGNYYQEEMQPMPPRRHIRLPVMNRGDIDQRMGPIMYSHVGDANYQ